MCFLDGMPYLHPVTSRLWGLGWNLRSMWLEETDFVPNTAWHEKLNCLKLFINHQIHIIRGFEHKLLL